MLVLALTVTERVSHPKTGKKQYRKGQTVFVRKRKGDRVKVTGPRNGRASYVTRWLDARQVECSRLVDVTIDFLERHKLPEVRTQDERRGLDPTHVPDVPLLLMMRGA